MKPIMEGLRTRTKVIGAMISAIIFPTGCASDTRYPSLAIRDVENDDAAYASGPLLDPTPPDARLFDRIAVSRQQAVAAHDRFMAAAPAARRAVRSARGASTSSTAWSSAQVALADLASLRSQAAIPLADLDRLYVEATIDFIRRGEIATARNEIIALVAAEDRVLAELGAALPSR